MSTSAAGQQDEGPGPVPSLMKPAEAAARMEAEQARELEAYTLGVQTVIWGMQRVKAGQTLRNFSAPLPAGIFRPPLRSRRAWCQRLGPRARPDHS